MVGCAFSLSWGRGSLHLDVGGVLYLEMEVLKGRYLEVAG